MKIMEWIKKHKMDLIIGGVTIASMGTIVLLYKKSLPNSVDIEKVFAFGKATGFEKVCQLLLQEGHKDILDDLIKKGLVVVKETV